MASIFTGIVGGIQGAHAAHDAAGAITDANNQAIGTINSGVDKANGLLGPAADAAIGYMNGAVGDAQARLDPYATNGASATSRLSDLANTQFKFSNDDPSYQWRLQQGEQALARSAAAHGRSMSGATMKAISNYGQNAASQEYQNAFNRFQADRSSRAGILSDLAGRGLAASAQQANYGIGGATYGGNLKYQTATDQSRNILGGANTVASLQANNGQAIAAGDMGAAQAWNGMLSGIGNGVNSILFGGFGGGGSFDPRGAAAGYPTVWGKPGHN